MRLSVPRVPPIDALSSGSWKLQVCSDRRPSRPGSLLGNGTSGHPFISKLGTGERQRGEGLRERLCNAVR